MYVYGYGRMYYLVMEGVLLALERLSVNSDAINRMFAMSVRY